jgi:hypothetical protein
MTKTLSTLKDDLAAATKSRNALLAEWSALADKQNTGKLQLITVIPGSTLKDACIGILRILKHEDTIVSIKSCSDLIATVKTLDNLAKTGKTKITKVEFNSIITALGQTFKGGYATAKALENISLALNGAAKQQNEDNSALQEANLAIKTAEDSIALLNNQIKSFDTADVAYKISESEVIEAVNK